jgi:hypothetical protein
MYYVRESTSRPGSPPASAAPALSAVLLEAPTTPRYVVQLCQSPTAVSPGNIPRLDLFDLYHLYSADARHENGAPRQALRLGFFKDPATARTIARYFGRYFESPRVLLIDAPEIMRALHRRFEALKILRPVSAAR